VTIDGVRIGSSICRLLIRSRLIGTSNYSATANLHNSQITTATAKPFPACCVFTSRSLAKALTVEIFQLHALKSSLDRLPYWTDLVAPVIFLITSRHGSLRKHCFIQFLYCCIWTVGVPMWWLPSQSIGALAAVSQRLLSRCLFRGLWLAMGLCATIEPFTVKFRCYSRKQRESRTAWVGLSVDIHTAVSGCAHGCIPM
jgi:hypothetical protein